MYSLPATGVCPPQEPGIAPAESALAQVKLRVAFLFAMFEYPAVGASPWIAHVASVNATQA